MDNLSNAIFMAFAMFALVIGLSFGLYLIGNMNSVATTLIRINDKTNDYQSISFDSSNIFTSGKKSENMQKRIVTSDMIISTLYRYFLESFSVEIYYKENVNKTEPDQLFDLTVESILSSNDNNNPEWIAYNKLYGEGGKGPDLFGAPWMVDREVYTKQRVDMFISSKEGYINGKLVNYSSTGFKDHLGSTFTEEFIQYSFDGETISSEQEGEEIETIVGSRRAQNKIIIRYIEIKK